MVGGNESDTSIQTVLKIDPLHVTRLNLKTNPEDLRKMLAVHFLEVTCEEHQSKPTTLYASMKVTIMQGNF